MKKMIKTNAMRMLEQAKIPYNVHTYEHEEGIASDGVHVAQMLHEPCEKVFKTILTQGTSRQYYVFVLPVAQELDFKKCAAFVHEKSIEMIAVKDITKVSGYVRGGCSPFGMKKQFPTIFHESCLAFDTIYFSGGKIGWQIEMNPKEAIELLKASYGDITRK